MKLITRETLAAKAAGKWAERYSNASRAIPHDLGKLDILVKLKNLGDSPNPDSVDEAIGNTSWTNPPECSQCGAADCPIVEVGEESDYESATAYLCSNCLRAALRLVEISYADVQ